MSAKSMAFTALAVVIGLIAYNKFVPASLKS